MKKIKSYKILSGHLKNKILNTKGCIQTEKGKIYGYIGWTPYLLDMKILKEF